MLLYFVIIYKEYDYEYGYKLQHLILNETLIIEWAKEWINSLDIIMWCLFLDTYRNEVLLHLYFVYAEKVISVLSYYSQVNFFQMKNLCSSLNKVEDFFSFSSDTKWLFIRSLLVLVAHQEKKEKKLAFWIALEKLYEEGWERQMRT